MSVIIPAFNAAAYLGATLRSLFDQTYTDFEGIVVNDGSTDDTEGVLEPYRNRIVYISQENRGPAGARNTGLARARGYYVALLDDDDIWMPDFLEKMVARLKFDPTIDVIFPNAVYFGKSQVVGKRHQDLFPPGEPVTFERLLTGESNIFYSAVFKRELLRTVGNFDEGLQIGCDDYDLWLRMARRGARFASTSEVLVAYRRHAGNISNNEEHMRRGAISVYQKLLAGPDATPRLVELLLPRIAEHEAAIRRQQAKRLILARDFGGAARELDAANRDSRSMKLTLVAAALRIAPGLLARLVANQQRAHGRR